ncbi:helix-turn-helix domain-containing protein [Actinomadura roseirufa]|uniref:helix-turn-helix domain-containing protein n=1 Tax=Actinomadura roseirufa TaxID=2094049 RepID=UPI001041BCE0|nr:helix-turn-helix transcriptional regulator [Actinomadura roseirufa]
MNGSRPEWADRIKTERETRGWTKPELARRMYRTMGITQGNIRSLARQITWHEYGQHRPTSWAHAYATVFDTTVEELFDIPDTSAIPGSTVGASTPSHARDDDMERRTVLQLAALGMSASALATTGEPIRQLLALTLDSEPRDIDGWHLALADHLHAIFTRPPAQVRDSLTVDLLAVQRQLPTTGPDETIELQRVVAALSYLYANALTRLGDHEAAIHWWRTAKAAADATGDLDLRLMIRCDEAQSGLYGQRDAATVVHLADTADRLTEAPVPFWRAQLAGTRATAFTLQGRHDEAHNVLNTFASFTGEAPALDILPTLWSDKRVHFSASWIHAGAGREALADQEREYILGRIRGYQYPVNVRLHEALCTVANGGTERGARQATEILAELPPAQRSEMINATGKAVLRAVPVEKRDRPAVRELRALTSRQGTAVLA